MLAVGLSLAIALGGWATRALTRSGAATATLVGTAILGRSGWPGMGALGAFFVGASLISRIAPDRSVLILDAKGSTRDGWQVLANGGAAAIGALLSSASSDAGLWVVTASLAAAAADTWATSCGGWSGRLPRHILTWRTVPPGTSGGITLIGTAGAFVGAATVGAAAALITGRLALFLLSLAVGMLGMIVDSIIGAAWQGRFHCPACGLATERSVHRCGNPTTAAGGLAWLTNDGVNGLATGFAAVLGYGLYLWAVGQQCCGP
jgi:uncharacterized protein (TIGR00297 family)